MLHHKMPAGVDVVDGIVQAIGIQIDAADRFGFKIADKIFVQESARLGIVVTAVQVVKPDGSIVVIPTITEGVILHDPAFRLLQEIPPGVVHILADQRAAYIFMILQNEQLVNPHYTAKGARISPCSLWVVFSESNE